MLATALASRPPAPVASTASVLEGSDDACFTSLWWATFVEGSQGHELRTWYRVEPVQANGALDTTIPTVRLFASAPWALGFCVSQLDSTRRVDTVQAWRVTAGAQAASEVGLERVTGVSPIDCDRGGLFAGPREASSSEQTGAPPVWPPGHYVFRVSFGEPEGSSEWFAIDIVSVREVSLEIGMDRPAPSSRVDAPPREGPNDGAAAATALPAATAPGRSGLSRASTQTVRGR